MGNSTLQLLLLPHRLVLLSLLRCFLHLFPGSSPGRAPGLRTGPAFLSPTLVSVSAPTAIQSHSCSAGKPVSHLGAPSRPHTPHPLTTPACKICPQSDPLPSLPLPALVQATQSLAGPLWSVASQPASRFLSCLHDHLCFMRKLDTSF